MIYIYKERPKNFVADNESEFAQVTYRKVLVNAKLRSLLEEVEKAEFVDESNIRTKYGVVTDILNISTGCKTLLNIVANSSRVYPVIECGCSIFDYLYRENTGCIYCSVLPPAIRCKATFIGVSESGNTQKLNLQEAMEWLSYGI